MTKIRNFRSKVETALGAVRNLMRALGNSGPLTHFRQQPFTSGNPDLDAAVQPLPLLEIKLLTAIADLATDQEFHYARIYRTAYRLVDDGR